ncbi:DUF2867 domain-containing protein [Nocardioides sp. GXZ039]|uniref:DUF2867 domain-containing protein n=1 Tax=Nocardioides sp. GXZ039 TaxID=3136018 RepID=UPI0030F4A2DD
MVTRGKDDTHATRIAPEDFRAQPWRIHELAEDFVVEDVWLLPTPSGPDGLDRYVALTTDGSSDLPLPVRALMALRWRIGAVVGWDRDDDGVGARIASLRDRLPEDLLTGDRGPDQRDLPMTSVYLTDREWVSEMGNKTVHALMHLGWVPVSEGSAEGGYRGQMAVLTKPNGRLGRLYMLAIKPVRRWIVYPLMFRGLAKDWASMSPDSR